MTEEKFRYFIELQTEVEAHYSRMEENERHREQALEIISRLRDWLEVQGLSEKVSVLTPTVFGQVQITCAAEVMQRLREDEEVVPIAAIRQGSLISWVNARAS